MCTNAYCDRVMNRLDHLTSSNRWGRREGGSCEGNRWGVRRTMGQGETSGLRFEGEGDSSPGDRFGLSQFNQVLNTSIVAHLEYSHHRLSSHLSSLRLSSSLSSFVALLLRLCLSSIVSFFSVRVSPFEFLQHTPSFLKGPVSILSVARKEP